MIRSWYAAAVAVDPSMPDDPDWGRFQGALVLTVREMAAYAGLQLRDDEAARCNLVATDPFGLFGDPVCPTLVIHVPVLTVEREPEPQEEPDDA